MLQNLFVEVGIAYKRTALWIKNGINPTPQVAFSKIYEPALYGTIGKPYLSKKHTKLAEILNKDIGFVHEGQKAEVKIDTFNFTKYGLIDAEISSISDDAIQDENLGLVYSARFKLAREEIQVDERMVKLSPGMSVTAEVKTGQRRLIEYFLSPLLRYKQESLGERW